MNDDSRQQGLGSKGEANTHLSYFDFINFAIQDPRNSLNGR